MKLIRFSLIITALFASYNVIAADSANRPVELTAWEKKKIEEEFSRYFKSTDSGALLRLNKNPWAGKRAKQNQRTNKILQVTASLDSCKQYSLKQRRQCYVTSNNTSACELFYNARIDNCNKRF